MARQTAAEKAAQAAENADDATEAAAPAPDAPPVEEPAPAATLTGSAAQQAAPAAAPKLRTYRARSTLPKPGGGSHRAGDLFQATDDDPRARSPFSRLVEDDDDAPAVVAEALDASTRQS